jgi:hypothetical protein
MRARKATNAGNERHKAGKERHKGRQGMAQTQARNGTNAGKERYEGGRKNTKAGQTSCKSSRQGIQQFKIKIINPINLYRRGQKI